MNVRRSALPAFAAVAATGALALAAVHRRFAVGAPSFRREYERLARAHVHTPQSHGVVDEHDLDALPEPVARFLRAAGAVGGPRVVNFRASIRGRIRSGPESPWMPFRGEQFNAYGAVPTRLFRINARMRGLPAEVFHSFVDADATMRVRALSMFPIINARGPEMNRSETVTILNDMCVFAPAALLDAAVVWDPIDDRSVRVTFDRLGETVSAVLHVDDRGLLVDFVSDDRSRSSADGSTFTQERWSTPLTHGRTTDGRWRCTYGEARWIPSTRRPDTSESGTADGGFTYLEIWIDDVAINVTTDELFDGVS
jgi:hypothetical protein